MTPKNGFLLFVASCLPGCGQMYQGYMKRGVSLLLAFALVFFISTYLFIGALVLFLPVIWLYAFFDSYNLRSRIAAGTAPEDTLLFGLSDTDSRRLRELLQTRRSLVGWALVALGAYMLYDMLLDQLADLLVGWTVFGTRLIDLLHYGLPRLVITVLVILLGVWFLRGPRKEEMPEDAPPFTPPASDAGASFGDAQAQAPSAESAAAETASEADAAAGEEAVPDEQP